MLRTPGQKQYLIPDELAHEGYARKGKGGRYCRQYRLGDEKNWIKEGTVNGKVRKLKSTYISGS
jgi:hypothetical protein